MFLFGGPVGSRWLWPYIGLCKEFEEYFPGAEVKLFCVCLRIDSPASSGWCIECWLLFRGTVALLDDATWARFVFKPSNCPIRISTMFKSILNFWPAKKSAEPSCQLRVCFFDQKQVQNKNCSALHPNDMKSTWVDEKSRRIYVLNMNRALAQALQLLHEIGGGQVRLHRVGLARNSKGNNLALRNHVPGSARNNDF